MSQTVTMADATTLANIKTNVGTMYDAMRAVNNGVRYGVRVDKKNSDPFTRVEYTFDAVGMTPAKMNYTKGTFEYGSWEDVWFVKDCYPVMLKYDGTVDYKLNPNNLAKKEDGTNSDYNNTAYAGNVMSRVPLVWVEFHQDGRYEYITVSNEKLNENYHAIAHTLEDGETVRDEVFISCYRGSVDGNGRLRSISGQTVSGSKTAAQEIAAAKLNNPSTRSDTNGWYTHTWGQRQLINALLLIIGRSDDSQTTFGNGNYAGGSDASSILKTGTCDTKGAFYGTNGTGAQVKVFNIEGWWGDQWNRIAGLINDNGTIKYTMTGPYNLDGAGYTVAGCPAPSGTNGGYISEVYTADCGRMPIVASGSSSTYLCDGLWFNNSQVDYTSVGGACWNDLLVGPAFWYLVNTAGNTHWTHGACLSYLA